MPTMTDILCENCGEGFTAEEWDARHSTESGYGELHDTCCRAVGPCSEDHD